jgi:hypothetical protein
MDARADGRCRDRRGVHRVPRMRSLGVHRGGRGIQGLGVPIRRRPDETHPDWNQRRTRDGMARELQAGRRAPRGRSSPPTGTPPTPSSSSRTSRWSTGC